MSIDRQYAAEILAEASRLINQERKNEHGDSFSLTAKMWSDYLGIEITEADFCILMALLKITRQKLGLKIKDHFIDGAAYVALAGAQSGIAQRANPVKPAAPPQPPKMPPVFDPDKDQEP